MKTITLGNFRLLSTLLKINKTNIRGMIMMSWFSFQLYWRSTVGASNAGPGYGYGQLSTLLKINLTLWAFLRADLHWLSTLLKINGSSATSWGSKVITTPFNSIEDQPSGKCENQCNAPHELSTLLKINYRARIWHGLSSISSFNSIEDQPQAVYEQEQGGEWDFQLYWRSTPKHLYNEFIESKFIFQLYWRST